MTLGLAGCAHPRPSPVLIGVDIPLAGADGGEGIQALNAVRLAVDEHNRLTHGHPAELAVRDPSAGGFQNPHRDEATGDWVDLPHARSNMQAFSQDHRVSAVIGGFNASFGRAEQTVAQARHIRLVRADTAAPLNERDREAFARTYLLQYLVKPGPVEERFYSATRGLLISFDS